MDEGIKETIGGGIIGFLIIGGLLLFLTNNNSPTHYSESTDYPESENSFYEYERNDDYETERSYEDYGDLDCSDFDYWEDAQEFFEEEGGPYDDYHNLDRDGDGIACESLQ